jgi:hypothetical protein
MVYVIVNFLFTNEQGKVSDAPPSSLMDSTPSPKVKTMEGEGVGVRSLASSTLGVEGRARAMG